MYREVWVCDLCGHRIMRTVTPLRTGGKLYREHSGMIAHQRFHEPNVVTWSRWRVNGSGQGLTPPQAVSGR